MVNFWDNMNDTLKKENNITFTENGAVAYKSTNNACLDAFGSLGAMRFSSDEDIIDIFEKAFNEDKKLAMKLLFYMRDIRGGQGQRNIFRVILKWLGDNHTEYVIKNLDNIIYYGRGDDYLCLLNTSAAEEVYEYLKQKISQDTLNMYAHKEVSLLAKWLPSENTSSKETRQYANSIIRVWRWTPKRYRKVISELRKYIDVTERKMSANEWKKINYETVPAKAAMNYSDAFYRHDEVGYKKYLESLVTNNSKINAKSLFPVDIIHKIYSCDIPTEKDIIIWDSMWKSLPNYFEGKNESGICVCDTSGSMFGTPLEVALSLGMYCADKCTGPFKNKFITFSESPQLVEFKGKDIYKKVINVKSIVANTNIEKVFDLILRTAINNRCKQEDIPSKVYIISDMQFDAAQGYGYYKPNYIKREEPFMKTIRDKFEKFGYKMPSLIYWNVRASKCGMFHDTVGGEDCAMVSGYSPSLFKSILEGTTLEEVVDEKGNVRIKETVDPMTVMLTTLNNERYDRVVV